MSFTHASYIETLYIAMFGRPADLGALTYWDGTIEAGRGSTAAVEAALGHADTVAKAFPGLDAKGIVNMIYSHLFHRDADSGGLAFWSQLATDGRLNAVQLVDAIAAGAQGEDRATLNAKVAAATALVASEQPTALLSDRDLNKFGYLLDAVTASHPALSADRSFLPLTGAPTDLVEEAYIAFLGRPADPAGFDFWTHGAMPGGGLPVSSLFDAFAHSAEFVQQGAGVAEVVTRLYRNMFSRDPEAGGLNFWTGLVKNGQLTIGELGHALAEGAQGMDAKTFQTKLAASWFLTRTFYDGMTDGDAAAAAGRSYLAGVTFEHPHPEDHPVHAGPIIADDGAAAILVGTPAPHPAFYLA